MGGCATIGRIARAPTRPRTGTVDVLVGLVSQIEDPTETDDLYDRICEALCSLTTLRRAVMLLYDPAHRIARPAGSHGVDRDLFAQVEATLDEAPIAQRALAEDRVVEASDDLETELPPRYARFAGITTVSCAPVAAGGRWFGVLFADQGGGQYTLSEEERQTMHMLGRLAALAATVEHSTRQHERTQSLDSRIALIREIHEQVIQRLFGLSLALGSEQPLTVEEMNRCSDELRIVLSDLRATLGRPLAPRGPETTITLKEMLERQAASSGLRFSWPDDAETPAHLEPLAQSVVVEALRNAGRHSDASSVEVNVSIDSEAFSVEVLNDGVRRRPGGAGIGLRLLTLEALQHDGLVEFGPVEGERWRVRLLAPVKP